MKEGRRTYIELKEGELYLRRGSVEKDFSSRERVLGNVTVVMDA